VGGALGPYRILAKIGEGGMGEVYRATDTNLNRRVAIKVLPAMVAQDAERLARFEREARTLAALNHPVADRNRRIGRMSEWNGDTESLADRTDRSTLQNGMPWHRCLRPVRRVDPDVVFSTGMMEEAARRSQMALEGAPLHAGRRVEAASLRNSFAREARSARSASFAIRKASCTDSASVTSSGSSGLVTTNPPSSAGVRIKTRRPSDTVYVFAISMECNSTERSRVGGAR
jgi:hypothetical protein